MALTWDPHGIEALFRWMCAMPAQDSAGKLMVAIGSQRVYDIYQHGGVPMLFEYDPVKSARNRAKHGIDFEQAKRLWSGKVVTVPSLGEYGEVRYVALGVIDGKHWTAVFTRRGERIRIISVRRSRKKEVEVYGEEDQR